MGRNSAVPAKILPEGEFAQPGDLGYPLGVPATAEIVVDEVKMAAARLYGKGYKRSQIARILLQHLVGPNTKCRNEEQKLAQARNKLRRWEGQEKFRDKIYHVAVVELDMATPDILKGVGYKAKRGRVDAARLALEVTGRHNPKGDQAVTNVTVQIANIPRPQRG